MTALTTFFTNRPLGETVVYEGTSAGINHYRYEGGLIYDLTLGKDIIPGMVNYELSYTESDGLLIALAKKYLREGGQEFIIIKTWMGYPTPSIKLMPEVVIDIKDSNSGEWPIAFITALPDKSIAKDYRLEKTAEEFLAMSPSKNNPWFEYFIKYYLIDSGTM